MSKVIWLGLPQIEIQEVNQRLKILGFTSYDIVEIFRSPEHVEVWTNVYLGKQKIDFSLFDGYDALLITPPTSFYKEIFKQYPNAKFIIEKVDGRVSYKRFKRVLTIHKSLFWLRIFKRTRDFMKMLDLDLMYISKGNPTPFHMQMRSNELMTEVQKTIPAHQLHMFEAEQGWKPLCEFLEVPIPTKKMPLKHKRSTRNLKIWEIVREGFQENIVFIGLYFFVLIAIFVYLIFFY